ncbi:conserved membrane hypothetical protein [Flavobacterium sp. 9AF]|uniref:M56 family metallopeptidase n=1 Tax=Flavobacterium sp. 9AF TaxID=2653142 RepID=UPI0012F1C461|nr:M56 family metallopeptidase [Flavobacterium sp. 9AF]VXB03319.1 conserved membrane hypothetical protein [Flavobacterium sp. 9AF]
MENLMLYILKVNGLLVVFYLIYHFQLKKETFFQINRSFLLLGIITSFVLPLISFTTIIWKDPEPLTSGYAYQTLPLNSFENKVEVAPFNWNLLFFLCYFLVSFFFLSKLLIEFISFFRIIKKGNKSKSEKIILVETNECQNPFSFFNYLVVNKGHFTTEELELILIHEKIHIEQKHSIDVLISKLLCLLFWANPIVWFYRKAILENLEFIADHQTSARSNKTYEYQKTLLKAVICANQLSITNQFYQSLIKKRIVMLNTNPSHKKQLWKYCLVLPLLIGFIFFFQIQTIAQVKENQNNNQQQQERVELRIDKNSTDEEIKKETKYLEEKYHLTVKVSKIKRNKEEEIVSLKMDYNDGKGNSGSTQISGDEPIKPYVFFINNNNGKRNMGFTSLSNENKSNATYTYESEDNDEEDALAYSYDEGNMPVPPMPPVPPSSKMLKSMPSPPSPPNFPQAPEVPSDLSDKQAMKNFEEKMAAFEMNMKKMQPQMEQFEREMEKYEMQMEDFEPDMKDFEKEMEKFEKEMEAYQEKMMKKHQYAYEYKVEKMNSRDALNEENKIHQEEMKRAHKEAMEAHKLEMKERKEALKMRMEAEKERMKMEMARMKAEMEREKAEQKRRSEALKKI